MGLTDLGAQTGWRIGELEIALRILQQWEALCLELGDKNGLQRSYGNQTVILKDWKTADIIGQAFLDERRVRL